MNIKFLRGTLAQYLACTKSADTLYFITDTGALYLGDKLIGKDYDVAIKALQDAGYQNAAQVGELISAALANYYTKGEVDNLLAGLGVAAIAGRVEAIEKDYLKAADKADLEGKINGKVSSEGYVAYSEAEKNKLAGLENYNDAEVRGLISGNTTEITAVRGIAEAARTEEEVNSQIDSKIAGLDLANTYEAKGAEERAKGYVDGKVEVINGRLDTAESNIGTLQEQIQGLSGAMHFKGVYYELPVTTSPIAQGDLIQTGVIVKIDTNFTPQIEGYFDLVEENSYFDFVKGPGYYYPIEFVRYDGNAFAIYEGITGGKLLLYVSEDVSDEKLAELGAVTRGWQVSEFTWRAGAPVNFVGYKSANPVITDNTCPFFFVEKPNGDFVTGDVIVVGDKEYVYDSINFIEFGDINAEGQRLTALEGKVEAIEDTPAMGILPTDIINWNNEKGAMKLASSKTTLAEVKGYVEGEKFAKEADLGELASKDSLSASDVGAYTIGEVNAKLAEKQDNLSEAQLAAVNSGISTSKVNTYDGIVNSIGEYAKTADIEDDIAKGVAAKNAIDHADTGLAAAHTKAQKGIDDAAAALGVANGKVSPEDLSNAIKAVTGSTNVTIEAVVKAINALYDGEENTENKINAIDTNIKDLEGALTWGEIK